jgi:endo-1,4-beta-xylanase
MLFRSLTGGPAVLLTLVGVVGPVFGQEKGQPRPHPLEVKDVNQGDPLRVVAERKKLHIGSCASPDSLRDKDGAAILARHFNLLVAENHMKWSFIHPALDRYAFEFADELVKFAEKHRMKVKGHTFIWHQTTPRYLHRFTADELRAALKDHIRTVMTRYKGRVTSWDVVNEALDDRDGLRKSLWLEKLGPDYIGDAFQIAHEVDPKAILIYNDYGCEGLGGKSDRQYAFLKRLVKAKVPVHEVGLQMHLGGDRLPRVEDIVANVRRLTELGLKVNISEMDLALGLLPGEMPAKLKAQADVYARIVRACTKENGFTGVTFWGYSDKYSWLNWRRGKNTRPRPLLFDENMKPKPAFFAVQEAFK